MQQDFLSLSARNLDVFKGKQRILKGINATFLRKQLAFVIGPNGAGKTTLMRSLAQLDQPSLAHAKKVAWVPAAQSVAFGFFVRDVVLMGRFPWHLGRPTQKDFERVEAALGDLQMQNFALTDIRKLSSGEQHRVQIARALASDADFLLLDEPFANLDLAMHFALINIFRREISLGRGIIISTHDLALAWKDGDHLVCLDRGEVVDSGLPKEVLSDAVLKKIFSLQGFSISFDGEDRLIFMPG